MKLFEQTVGHMLTQVSW